MLSATLEVLKQKIDGAVFCAAVADYKVTNQASQKIKKDTHDFALDFEENPDILHTVCQHKNRPEIVIGFSAETENVISNASKKRLRKGCNMIVANTVSKDSFGANTSQAYIIDDSSTTELGTIPKTKVALHITDYIKRIIC